MIGNIANPALIADLHTNRTGTNTLANPRIRVRNHEKAKVHIGDKLPVFTTTATANVGVSASVSYLDVGLQLEIESNVYLNNEVGIKLGLEVSSVTQTVTGPAGSIAYQIGTRITNTSLRLRDGETQILAGLINDQELKNAGLIPGLGDLPVLGRLFSNHIDTHNKTEVVLLITPHVLRNLTPPESAGYEQNSGTDEQFGAAPLRLRMAGPGSLSLQSAAGPGLLTGAIGDNGSGEGVNSFETRRAAIAARRAAAGGLPPGAPAAATAPAPAAAVAAVASPAGSAPPPAVASPPGGDAAAGSSALTAVNTSALPVAMSMSTSGDMPSGTLQVDVSYPPDLLQPVGTTAVQPGRVTLNLSGPGAVPVRFKAVAPAGTTVSLAIAAVRAADGSAAQFLPPNPVSLVITP
jgi:general secretion pathway protein D